MPEAWASRPAAAAPINIGLKIDVDTLRGTREGVPRLVALLEKHQADATFYFSVGPDHTGRAIRRAFRPGFAKKVVRTSVLEHYGLKTLMYGVLLPGPDIGRRAGDAMRGARDAGFEVGLHSYDHVRWQDHVAGADARWTRAEFERGVAAFERIFRAPPASHAAAGWQMNSHAFELECAHGMRFASDTRGASPFYPVLASGVSPCMQLPTTLPTFDELLGRDGIDPGNIADALFERSQRAELPSFQVFTLHAELEGGRLAGAFESLLALWRRTGASLGRLSDLHERARSLPVPSASVRMQEIAGRSGLLATQIPARDGARA